MVKKRGPNQRLEENSRNALRGALSDWVVNDLSDDFGLDFHVQLARSTEDEYREVTSFGCLIQLKASENFDSRDTVFHDFDYDFFESYWQSDFPVLIVIYEDSSSSLYWICLQEFVEKSLQEENPSWWSQDYIRVTIPRDNEIDDIDELGRQIDSISRNILTRRERRRQRTEYGKEDHSAESIIHHLSLFQRATVSMAEEADNEWYQTEQLKLLRNSFENHTIDYIPKSEFIAGGTYLFIGYEVAKRAKILASELSLTELSAFFDQQRREFWSEIHSYIVGNEFLNCKIDEHFHVIDVYDLCADSSQILWFAEMQYSDGTFWDENARAIIQRLDYQLTKYNIAEEGITVNNSCGEENHNLISKETSSGESELFCEQCGLSYMSIAEGAGEWLPARCDRCGTLTENWNNEIPICTDCHMPE